MKRPIAPLLAAIGIFIVAAPASAHHSLSLFDREAMRVVEGSVKDFHWASPHVWIFVTVPDGNGGTLDLAVEGGSPYTMTRAGWSPASVKAGDHVKIEYYPRADGETGGLLDYMIRSDGKKLSWKPFSLL